MGGKSSAPPPPDYTPFITASQNAAASDAKAAQIQADVARDQLDQQNVYANRAANLGDRYAQMAQDQAAYGKQQYEDIKPYLQNYMQSQLGWSNAAEENERAQAQAAAISAQQAQDTYNRYTSVYAPREDQFTNEAFNYASAARQDQNAAAARGDVAGAFQAQGDAAKRQLASYGIDPTQGAYAGRTQALDISKAASMAAAGTMARQQTEAQGKQYELAALEIGQKLPAQAIGQAGLALNQVSSGMSGAQVGGAGVAAGNQSLGAMTTAMGSPTAYAALNPYTQLTGVYGQQSTGMYGNQNQALGNISSAIGAGSGAMNNMYSNQMENYKATQAQSPWGAIGQVAGMGMGFLGMPTSSIGGKLFGF
jgi:hypothetical protein